MAAKGSNTVDNNSKYIKAMEEKYNFDIDVLPCYGDEYSNQVKMLLSSGQVPDVIRLDEGLQMADLVNQDLLAEITMDELNTYMPDYVAQVSKYSDSPFKYAKIDGKIYGTISQNPDGDYHFTCIWRSDWLKNVGITKTPETLDEYEQALTKFAKEDPDKNGKADTFGLSDRGMTPIYGAFGYLPYRLEAEYYALKDGKVVHSASQPEMKNALKLLNKWYTAGIIDPEFLTGERTTGHWSSSQAFAKGTIGFTSTGMYYNTGRASEFGRDGKFW
jgi:putative aldouronate transport system substrate-binding protein